MDSMSVSKNYYMIFNNCSAEEVRVLHSMIRHIESSNRKVSITQIAAENFISTSFIVKMCKKLGFDGYSELFYYLSTNEQNAKSIQEQPQLSQYPPKDVERFCSILRSNRQRNGFAVGAGFGAVVAEYIVQRLAICGFMMYNSVHFYDYMMFTKSRKDLQKPVIETNINPSFMMAISQSGETKEVLNNIRIAKEYGFQIISFTRVDSSTLAQMSDVVFLVEPVKQVLLGQMPNRFFGNVILTFEELMGTYLANP